MPATSTTTCSICFNPVSEMGSYVKLGLKERVHAACYADRMADAKLAQQEAVLTEGFIRKEKELLEQINSLKAAKGETSVVISRESTQTFDTKTWDEAAEKICKLAIAHIGPAIPLGTLKRYAWFIYTKLRDQKLIQPLQDDKAEETPSETMERSKKELEEWLRKSSK